MKKELKKSKHVDTVVNSIQPLSSSITNALSKKHNNPRSQVDFSQQTYQHLIVQIKIYFLMKSVNHMTIKHHFPCIPFFFQGCKSCIGIKLSTDDLKVLSSPLNVSSSSVISGITTPFSLRNINLNGS